MKDEKSDEKIRTTTFMKINTSRKINSANVFPSARTKSLKKYNDGKDIRRRKTK